jgi:tRNA (guanine-N7-)-methyltransferase
VTFRAHYLERVATRRAELSAEITRLLPTQRSIVWEVGSGHGHFLVRYAAEHPEKFCVGVDLITDRLERGDRKRNRAALGNCHFIRAEAREFLNALPPQVKFEEVWVLFPDPWPKARHNKNRLLKPPFFEAIGARSAPGARFFFRTDHADYFEEVLRFFGKGEIPTWAIDANAQWPLEQQTVFQARAPSYQSLVAVRTTHPARSIEVLAPGQPPRASPTSPA